MYAPQEIMQHVLSQLNAQGWEGGRASVDAEIQATRNTSRRAELQLFMGWMGAERGQPTVAVEYFHAAKQAPEFQCWSLAGQAYVAMRQRNYQQATELLDHASGGATYDPLLRATIEHYRGAIAYHHDRVDDALLNLRDAFELYGSNHFATGRVLDTLGMVYQAKFNFDAARRFFEASIRHKEVVADWAGLALTHGNLGRLHLDWGLLDQAESHFLRDYAFATQIGDESGLAICENWLGIVAMERGSWQEATTLLARSIDRCAKLPTRIAEGFARKDCAVALVRMGKLVAAAEQADRAAEIFESAGFSEGLAHLALARGILLRQRGEWLKASEMLRDGAAYFAGLAQWADAARLQLELARTTRKGPQSEQQVADELRQALDWAEHTRRDQIIGEIESELHEVDRAAFYQHLYWRTRGRSWTKETQSLHAGHRESATIMFLDLKDSVLHSRDTDPQIIMLTFNQMMAEFSDVLKRHSANISCYLGDGFMAMFQGECHAVRGVSAALDLFATLPRFNLPRQLLRLAPFELRIGLGSGEVSIGNVGTYDKMVFTALGTAANLAARLQTQAIPGTPCISQATRDLLPGEFEFSKESPRTVLLKGFAHQGVSAWDVVQRRDPA